MIKRLLYILTFIGSLLYSQEYCAGEQISSTHQNQIFNVCYGECDCEGWSLSDYSGDIIFLDLSASWCAPCFSSIDIIDDLEQYWSDENANVRFVTALSDIGEPYSCNQWGIEGVIGSPLIVEDDGSLFDWFKDSNGQYPSYVLIDHTMTVRAKPSNMFSNSNDGSCDGDNLEGECLNSLITDLLDACGDGCSSGAGCSDESACNNGDNTDCIYPQDNHDCCGECIVEIDCLGVCGGDATEAECGSTTYECNLPTCHLVSSDSEIYSTIQAGINAAQDGDTVLVEQGTYYENIVIQKNITLASRAIFDDLDGWVGYSDEYFVNNENINSTILNGSADTNGEGFESVLLIESLDDCIEPLIFGFTITGGEGTIVMVEVEGRENDRTQVEQIRGGGFLAVNALPMFKHNAIIQNKGNTTPIHSGGGGDQTSGVDIPTHPDFNWDSPRTECDGELDLSYNFYKDNDATYGNTLSTKGFEGSIDMSSSIFDVYDCPEDEVTTVWVDVEDEVEVDFSYGVGDLCSITDDVWVSPDGDDNNLGTSESEAFLTIGRALEMIAPEDDDPVTINLTEGTFSPSNTGETFPITMISNVNLVGQGEDITIIDAEETDRVITMDNCQNNIISDLTITGGVTNIDFGNSTSNFGGGMSLWSSHPTLTNVTIANNTANYGGGMSLYSSNPTLTNVTISNNTAGGGGGMYLSGSNPTLTNVTISNNTTVAGYGGGMLLGDSHPILTNVTISNNTANVVGGGMFLGSSNPILTNVNISNNTAEYNGGGMYLEDSDPTFTNSIIWDNSPESIYGSGAIITYSDIEGGWQGDGNIDVDPLFTDPESGDYTLMEGSLCIDSGDTNLWYEDLNGTPSDMGVTGGLYALPNFTSHDFGDIGYIGSEKSFTLYNYRETSITIDAVQFNTSSFTAETFSPFTIEPFEAGIIIIDVDIDSVGYIQDNMEIISDDLPAGLSVSLSVTGVEGNVLNGNLSGEYEVATYRISGDLIIAQGDTVYIEAGTEFLFDGQYDFNIYGTLKAIGTEHDSIIFDNFGDEKWSGFTLDNCSDETELKYVRIYGADKSEGGGMYLYFSNPTLSNVTIANNTAALGGGMNLDDSHPTITNVTIANNTAAITGGGVLLAYSNPTITNVTIANNTADYAGGMSLAYSNPTITNVTIANNTANAGGGMLLADSHPTITNVTIANNTAEYGGGMYLDDSDPTFTNSIIWDNSPESIGGSGAIITYSDIEGGWQGDGNIDSDPLFTDPENGDYTLQENSPCIDAGIAIEDMEYCGDAPDMGAYEYITEDCEECPDSIEGDINFDGLVNILDIVIVVNCILSDSCDICFDINVDEQLNILDIVLIVNIILNS